MSSARPTIGKALLATLGVVALSLPACGDVELRSHPRGGAVVVDGKYDDWSDKLTWVEKIDMSVGAQNDESDLYFVLVIGDREVQRRIMMSGLFLWFDGGGEDDKQFGVHYPLGMGDPSEFVRPERDRVRDPEKMRAKFEEESLGEVELIGAGGDVRMTRSPDNLPDIEVAVSRERGAMVVEYRIPLAATVDSPYGVGAVPGTRVGVGLMTPEIDMSKKPAERPDRGERPAGGPPGGGRGGMGRRPDGGGMPDVPAPIDLWAHLLLAPAHSN